MWDGIFTRDGNFPILWDARSCWRLFGANCQSIWKITDQLMLTWIFKSKKSPFFGIFYIFLFHWFYTFFFWIFGIFWEFPKSQEFTKILWIFRDWDPTLFGKNPMEFKIPGIGILFRGIGIFHEKATSAHKLRFVTKNLGIVTLSQ